MEAPVPADRLSPDPLVQPFRPPDQLVAADGRTVDAVLREYQEQLRDEALHQLVVQSGLALGVMALASVGLGWVVAGRALRPLQDVTTAARRLSKDNLHERLDLQGPHDELKELADTFDAMLERLEAAFESQKRFVANASHELRTPLSIQRTLIDVALADPDASPDELRTMAVAVRDAVDRSEQLIDGLLVLARTEQGNLSREVVDVSAAAALAVDAVADEAGKAGLRVETRSAPARVEGNRVLLDRLLLNLVQNAVRHNVDAGWIELDTGTEDGTVVIRVANSGPAINPEQVDGLFQPFRRLAPERTDSSRGVGLGLSIVRAVSTVHGGTVRAQPLDAGGLEIVVELPAAPEEPGAAESTANSSTVVKTRSPANAKLSSAR